MLNIILHIILLIMIYFKYFIFIFWMACTQLQAVDFTNSIGIQFVNIKSGNFYMGSCQKLPADLKQDKKQNFMGFNSNSLCPSGAALDPNALSNEYPQHDVFISKPFKMGIYEVTLGQFKRFIEAQDRDDLLTDDFIAANGNGDRAAVVSVSWKDAQDFIQWLNKKEQTKKHHRYALPTEAQWEYAARAGTDTHYYYGNNSAKLVSYAWYDQNIYNMGRRYTQPVGQKIPNAWGLYDIHGNASEWVLDRYRKNYKRSKHIDPEGPFFGSERVIRGGSWMGGEAVQRSASRISAPPNTRDEDIGFRIILQN